nr:hypothetical protein [Tanacetum cinerariifolium]
MERVVVSTRILSRGENFTRICNQELMARGSELFKLTRKMWFWRLSKTSRLGDEGIKYSMWTEGVSRLLLNVAENTVTRLPKGYREWF